MRGVDYVRLYCVALLTDLLALLSGIFSVVVWIIAAVRVDLHAQWSLWVLGAVGMMVAGFRVWKREYDARQQIADQITPRLTISSVTEREGDHLRVRVNNLSTTTVRFAARLVSITPTIGCLLPVALRPTHNPAEAEADIPGNGSMWVDVLAVLGEGEIRLLVMGFPPETNIPLPNRDRYEICITAFPVLPRGAPASRRFHIIFPTSPTGRLVVSDAGVPPG
jgi:hypothetical protein